MKPVVGILCCGFDGKNQFVTDTYVRAVRISGGIPLLIPILPQDFPINSYLDICDGFLLPGGGDFTPFLFNEDPLPGVGQTNLSVDLFQIHFAEEILKRHLPVIGICRGMQVLNAACGGSIYQDLSCQPGDPFLHMQTSQNRSDMWHQIFIAKDSHLHELTGDTLYTNSFHHQSVHLLGKNVHACAHTSDGTVVASGIHVFYFSMYAGIVFAFRPVDASRNRLNPFCRAADSAVCGPFRIYVYYVHKRS